MRHCPRSHMASGNWVLSIHGGSEKQETPAPSRPRCFAGTARCRSVKGGEKLGNTEATGRKPNGQSSQHPVQLPKPSWRLCRRRRSLKANILCCGQKLRFNVGEDSTENPTRKMHSRGTETFPKARGMEIRGARQQQKNRHRSSLSNHRTPRELALRGGPGTWGNRCARHPGIGCSGF